MTIKHKIKDCIIKEFSITTSRNIAIVQVPDQYSLGMLFLRYQEFYESPNKKFNNSPFTILEFMDWYRREMGDKCFSYPEDYIGYNIPVDSMVKCHGCIPFGDLNEYDKIMYMIISECIANRVKYVIGVPNYLNNKIDATFKHEVAHALWYTNPLYKSEMLDLINGLTDTQYKSMVKCLKEYMYGPNHYDDETQAYMATGLHGDMGKIPGIKNRVTLFRKQFNKYYKPFIQEILKKTAPLPRQKK